MTGRIFACCFPFNTKASCPYWTGSSLLCRHTELIHKCRNHTSMAVVDQVHFIRKVEHGVHHPNDGLCIDPMHTRAALNGKRILYLAQALNEFHDFSLTRQTYMYSFTILTQNNTLLKESRWKRFHPASKAYHFTQALSSIILNLNTCFTQFLQSVSFSFLNSACIHSCSCILLMYVYYTKITLCNNAALDYTIF